MVVISKEKPMPGHSLDGKLTGEIEDMADKDKIEVIRCLYRMAVRQTPNYKDLSEELKDYNVVLSSKPDMVNLSEINEKYAMAQAYHSRVSTIEMQAIGNFDAWSNLRKTMDAYIEEKSSEYLVQKDILELPNTVIQQASVRNKLKRAYRLLSESSSKENEAKSFMKIIESKKGDLNSVIMNLTRQVKVIALEKENTNH